MLIAADPNHDVLVAPAHGAENFIGHKAERVRQEVADMFAYLLQIADVLDTDGAADVAKTVPTTAPVIHIGSITGTGVPSRMTTPTGRGDK